MPIFTKDAAKILGVPKETVARWCRNGVIAAEKDKFGFYKIDIDSLAEFCVKNRPLNKFTPVDFCPYRLLIFREVLVNKILELDSDPWKICYTTIEVAKMTGYNRQSIVKLITDGVLKATKSFRRYQIREPDIAHCAVIYPNFRRHLCSTTPSDENLKIAKNRILEAVNHELDH